jgi:formylglycine-generating enzyme required for sulfatase activity
MLREAAGVALLVALLAGWGCAGGGSKQVDQVDQDTVGGQDLQLDTQALDTLDSQALDTLDTQALDTRDSLGQDTLDTQALDTRDSLGQDTLDTQALDTLDSLGQDTLDTQALDTLAQVDTAGDTALPLELPWVALPAGTFTMGCSPEDANCEDPEKPAHTVTLAAFELMATEVTEGQYEAVLGLTPACSYSGGGPDFPVECVYWAEAKAFCEAVGGRLPTEAEWEYAARAGTTTKYPCGDDPSCLGDLAWYSANSDAKKQPVKGRAANAFGLYDMLGNVWEYTADWYELYEGQPQTNPQGPETGVNRAMRGGGFSFGADSLRVSNRGAIFPTDYAHYVGFRCAR